MNGQFKIGATIPVFFDKQSPERSLLFLEGSAISTVFLYIAVASTILGATFAAIANMV